MRPLLVLAAGSILLLLVPLPPGPVTLSLQAGWLAILATAALWQLWRLLAHNRHVFGVWLGLRPARAAPGYVRDLFDTYADRYDAHLFFELDYRGPNLVRAIVGERLDDRAGTLGMADLGCGTGACGPLFRRLAAHLVGVDLSRAMLERAWARDVYDALEQADIAASLGARPDAFDLLIAADSLVYIGDLRPVLDAAAKALRPGGLLAFTVERGRGESWRAQRTGRFAHGSPYVRRTAEVAGLEVVEAREADLRREGDAMVLGEVWLLRRPDSV